MQIDSLPSYVVAVAASNHPELLDRAVWRRFQIRLELPMPKQRQVEDWFRRFETDSGYALGVSPRSLAMRLKGLSFSEIEDFGADVIRRTILAYPDGDAKNIVGQRLRHWKKRFAAESANTHEEGN